MKQVFYGESRVIETNGEMVFIDSDVQEMIRLIKEDHPNAVFNSIEISPIHKDGVEVDNKFLVTVRMYEVLSCD